jgi:hypothetical protein
VKERVLTIPEIVLIGGTRVALGVGLGFLIADKLSRDARKGAGWALLAIGALSTVPLALDILGKPAIAGHGHS